LKELIGNPQDFLSVVESLASTVTLFRGQANALHGLVPGIGRNHPDYVPTKELERVLLSEFKRRSQRFTTKPRPTSDWDWLILGQHHGLKTRLLDWTSDWRVALYFSLLPHDEMYRVPYSVFILPNPSIIPYEALPRDPFSLTRNCYFEAPKIHPRITGQRAYVGAYANLNEATDDPGLVQFSFYPYPKNRQDLNRILARSQITAEKLTPGLDGICRTLVDQPRIATGIHLPRPKVSRDEDWRPVPASAIGKKVGQIRPELIAKRTLVLILDWVGPENIIGIPCYENDHLFGYLKYVNRLRTQFTFLRPDGLSTVVIRSTENTFESIQIARAHAERLFSKAPPTLIRPIKIKIA